MEITGRALSSGCGRNCGQTVTTIRKRTTPWRDVLNAPVCTDDVRTIFVLFLLLTVSSGIQSRVSQGVEHSGYLEATPGGRQKLPRGFGQEVGDDGHGAGSSTSES